jgi:hypothetical protein
MPPLRSLKIWHCSKLKAFSDYVLKSTIQEQLQITDSPILEEQFKDIFLIPTEEVMCSPFAS